jgi:hypothetical protein
LTQDSSMFECLDVWMFECLCPSIAGLNGALGWPIVFYLLYYKVNLNKLCM